MPISPLFSGWGTFMLGVFELAIIDDCAIMVDCYYLYSEGSCVTISMCLRNVGPPVLLVLLKLKTLL